MVQKFDPMRVSYGELSKQLKAQVDLMIPTKKGKKSMCRTNLIKLMQWCYFQGVMDTGDDMAKICFTDDIIDKSDIQATISLHFSQKMKGLNTQRGREISELGNLCAVMQSVSDEHRVHR